MSVVNLSDAIKLAVEFGVFRERLMRAGLLRTAHAMQPAQDLIAIEIEEAILKRNQGA